ncbi:hypothetical protein G9A89_022376 [Geosiphon pyriformis]|nr:hypothetical protein G9A89_022376 [Geosiphon pyriformis]
MSDDDATKGTPYIIGEDGQGLIESTMEKAREARAKVSETASRFTEKAAETFKSTTGYDGGDQYKGFIGTLYHMTYPVIDIYKALSSYFPPLAWFLYGAAALNAVPVVLMLGYLAITTLICFAIAGGFIFFVEGFFVLLGCGVVLPVIGFALFAAFIAFLFAVLGYGIFRLVRGLLWAVGFIGERGEVLSGLSSNDTASATAEQYRLGNGRRNGNHVFTRR